MLVSDFNPVWSTYHVFSNNNSYLCSSECPRIMKWISEFLCWTSRSCFFSGFYQLGVKFCENVKSNVFAFFKKWEHANTNISARNQNDVSNKWKVSWKQDAVLECRLQVHTEALRGFLFLQWVWSKMLSHRCLIPENRWKRFCQDNIPKFPFLFIYFYQWNQVGENSQDIVFNVWKVRKNVRGSFLFIYLVWNLVKTDVEDSLPPCVKLSGRKIHEISSWKTKWITFIQV